MRNTGKFLVCRYHFLICLAAVAACSNSGESPQAVDQASENYHVFSCGDAGPARLHFVGPDTIELVVNDSDALYLNSERTASGAKYVKGDVVFWNKGDEALLEIGEQRHTCSRLSSSQ